MDDAFPPFYCLQCLRVSLFIAFVLGDFTIKSYLIELVLRNLWDKIVCLFVFPLQRKYLVGLCVIPGCLLPWQCFN